MQLLNAITYVLLLLSVIALITPAFSANVDDFAEFDDEELASIETPAKSAPTPVDPAPEIKPEPSVNANNDNEDIVVENDDEDDLTIDDSSKDSSEQVDTEKSKAPKTHDLKITNIPYHLRNNWSGYYLEIVLIVGLLCYFINFISGKQSNQQIVNAWYDANYDLLQRNFALVGDDGKKEIENFGFIKESESFFILWCSGRTGVESLVVELKLLKRHDLLSVLTRLVHPAQDQMIIKVFLDSDSMDDYVFCLANKRKALKTVKELNDVATFCVEKSTEQYGITDPNFILLNEIGEAAMSLMDPYFMNIFNKYANCIDYIHVSDQFSGQRMAEDVQSGKMPEVRKVMTFSFTFPPEAVNSSQDMSSVLPLMDLVFNIINKVKNLRLKKDAKAKSVRNRKKIEEMFLKAAHQQRQEAAQLKREEKRRIEKEKILQENDPIKQRKWEDKEHKREMKRKTPKMKQLKVKSI